MLRFATTAMYVMVFVALLASCMSAQVLQQDQPPSPGYGVFGNIHRNMHEADFHALPGIPSCCPRYSDGDGGGFGIGVLYEIPVTMRSSLVLRASYATHSALLLSRELTTVGIGGVPTEAIIEHSIDAGLSSLGFEPLVGYRLIGGLRFHVGGRIGAVLGKEYKQREKLVEPDGTFENGQRTRNVLSGDIPEASSLFGTLVAGISYALPMNEQGTLSLRPELLFSLGITPIVNDLTWNANAARLGLSIVYSTRTEAVSVELFTPPPPVPQPTPTPVVRAADISVEVVDGPGEQAVIEEVVVEEFISTQFRPLLTYVFFDENDSNIPSRYRTLNSAQAASFDIDDLHQAGMLELHHHVLNIIGWRLRQHPSATITITGCNANMGEEAGNTALSRARAETVRAYLKNAWNIAENRLSVFARDLPARPSGSEHEDGIVENRRVELSSSMWEILEPVVTRDYERKATPSRLRFTPTLGIDVGIRNWSVTVTENGRRLKRFEGVGNPPETMLWDMAHERESIPRSSGTLEYVLNVVDEIDRTWSVSGSLRIDQRKVDREVGRYSLILFDFDRATLNPYNRRIADMIRSAIDFDASVRITGYSDRIGEAEYNRKLSEDRARNVARLLGVRGARVEGLGQSVELHDNNLPEGRFYSRTVNILVEK